MEEIASRMSQMEEVMQVLMSKDLTLQRQQQLQQDKVNLTSVQSQLSSDTEPGWSADAASSQNPMLPMERLVAVLTEQF